MKPAKAWAAKIRELLGNSLRYEPKLTTGKSLIETIVEEIQLDAASKEKPETVTAQPNVPDQRPPI